jgi:hypothetical protein
LRGTKIARRAVVFGGVSVLTTSVCWLIRFQNKGLPDSVVAKPVQRAAILQTTGSMASTKRLNITGFGADGFELKTQPPTNGTTRSLSTHQNIL